MRHRLPVSGNTSQATLGTIVEVLARSERDTGLDIDAIREISNYWEAVRGHYVAFESGMQAPASEVYLHEMPGDQFTNLKAQARSLGLEERWHEVAKTYAEVNKMFGDIVKVTPSSKVVGDMALIMVSQGLTREALEDPARDISFPDSVVDMMRGNLGRPAGGFPEALQKKILKGEEPLEGRPGKYLPPVDFEEKRKEASETAGGVEIDDEDLNSYLVYPKVFAEYRKRFEEYGPVRALPTSTFFYVMEPGEKISVEIDPGKTLEIRCQAIGETDDNGSVKVFFKLNGQPWLIRMVDRLHGGGAVKAQPKAEEGNANHVGAPARCHRLACREGWHQGERRRSDDDHRGDEDGDRHPRPAQCRHLRRSRRSGRSDRRQGPVDGIRG